MALALRTTTGYQVVERAGVDARRKRVHQLLREALPLAELERPAVGLVVADDDRRAAENGEGARALRRLGLHLVHALARQHVGLEHQRAFRHDRQRRLRRIAWTDDE